MGSSVRQLVTVSLVKMRLKGPDVSRSCLAMVRTKKLRFVHPLPKNILPLLRPFEASQCNPSGNTNPSTRPGQP